MVMVSEQYPHILQVKDDNGVWQDVAVCRDQPNDKGEPIPEADGRYYIYSSLIFMPGDSAALLKGEDVRVVGATSEVRLEGEVKRVSADTFHKRIWV